MKTRCLMCHRPVPAGRRVYAHPLCYDCLPKPDPLPVIPVQRPRIFQLVLTCNKCGTVETFDLTTMPAESDPFRFVEAAHRWVVFNGQPFDAYCSTCADNGSFATVCECPVCVALREQLRAGELQ